ncbi:MAG: hypothetical protein N2559_14475 [Anaerolineae bacterium]|nr:hypothetical protein [Anaerolineae bacterium]
MTLILLACNLVPLSPTPIAPTPSPTRAPTATLTRTPRAGAPTWWDARLALPASFDFQGDARRALWSTRETNIESIKDFLVEQARAAGYQVFVVTKSPRAIYDVLCVRGQDALAINLTLGTDTTIVRAVRVGVLHLKVSGEANIELALPLRARLDVTPGSEWSVGTAVPSPQCARCEYFVNVLIAPFKGVGDYNSKAGTYLIDVQVIPGGDPDQDDFRWAIGGCTVTVRENSGAFACQQLQNVNDQRKRIDVSGQWTQPPSD